MMPLHAFLLALVMLVTTSAGASQQRSRVDVSMEPGCPSHLPGTQPLYIADPVPPETSEGRWGFACYGACGPSCKCVGKRDGRREILVDKKRCVYFVRECRTHAFCRWHDLCYLRCDEGYSSPGRKENRLRCYRQCDVACRSGEPPAIPHVERLPAPPGGQNSFRDCAEWGLSALGRSINGTYDGMIVFSELYHIRGPR